MAKIEDVASTEKPQLSQQEVQLLLLKTVKSLGINIDMVTLDIILSLKEDVEFFGKDLSMGSIEKTANLVIAKYQQK